MVANAMGSHQWTTFISESEESRLRIRTSCLVGKNKSFWCQMTVTARSANVKA